MLARAASSKPVHFDSCDRHQRTALQHCANLTDIQAMVGNTAVARLVLFTLSALVISCRPLSEPPVAEIPARLASAAPGHELSFRLGHTSSSTSLYEQDAQAFLALVAQRTNGAVHGSSFPSGQLANQQEMLEQVQLGSLEMVIASSETSSVVSEFGIFDLPFLFPDRGAVKAAVDGPLGAELARLAERKNLILLVNWKMVSAR